MDEAAIRAALGPELVDDFLAGAAEAGDAYLPGDEDLVFGFVQRVLVRLKQAGKNRGLLFPKFDEQYQPMFDYFDADGAIWVIRREELTADPGWFRVLETGDPERTYHGLVPGAARAIVLAFLAALAALKGRVGSRVATP